MPAHHYRSHPDGQRVSQHHSRASRDVGALTKRLPTVPPPCRVLERMVSLGSVVTGYRIERLLGTGGMGTVYLTKNPTLPGATR